MNEVPNGTVAVRRFRFAAALLVTCAVLSIAIHILHYLDYPPEFFSSVGVVKVTSAAAEPGTVRDDDWPAIVAKQLEAGHPPEHYRLEVEAVRNTSLVRFCVTGASPERSRALAAWLTDSFTQSLRRSLENGTPTPLSGVPIAVNRADEPASALRFPSALLALQLATPCLLLLSGFLLLKACKGR